MAETRLSSGAERSPLAGMVLLVVVGCALGVLYNYVGLQSKNPWGLTWLATDPMEALENAPKVGAVADAGNYSTNLTDPLAPVNVNANLPVIPDAGRWVQVDLAALKQLWDAGAAVIADAREEFEYEESHIPGAISLPYATASTDPVLLESLQTGDKPIIVYCGGGACELSIKLADELIYAGKPRVAVYEGGFPEWVEAGYPVETGGE